MDAAVELSDASQVLDLINIRIQLMYVRSMGGGEGEKRIRLRSRRC